MARYGWTPAARERGTIVVHAAGRTYWLRLAERDALGIALDGRADWFRGTDNFGAFVRFRTEEVTGVVVHTPEAIAASIEDDEQSTAEDDTDGEGWKARRRWR